MPSAKHLEDTLINAQNLKTAKTGTRQGTHMWALKVALLALLIQALMPISQSMAASNTVSSSLLEFCTQFGIQLQSVDQDGNPLSSATGVPTAPVTTKASWDCPVCQLQIGTDTPKPQIFAFIANGFEKNNIETAPDSLLAETYYKGPNPPRAPPVT